MTELDPRCSLPTLEITSPKLFLKNTLFFTKGINGT